MQFPPLPYYIHSIWSKYSLQYLDLKTKPKNLNRYENHTKHCVIIHCNCINVINCKNVITTYVILNIVKNVIIYPTLKCICLSKPYISSLVYCIHSHSHCVMWSSTSVTLYAKYVTAPLPITIRSKSSASDNAIKQRLTTNDTRIAASLYILVFSSNSILIHKRLLVKCDRENIK